MKNMTHVKRHSREVKIKFTPSKTGFITQSAGRYLLFQRAATLGIPLKDRQKFVNPILVQLKKDGNLTNAFESLDFNWEAGEPAYGQASVLDR